MEFNKVKNIIDKLNKYDYLSKEDSTISITEWANGEGYDISINEKYISITRGELDGINYLIKKMDYEFG